MPESKQPTVATLAALAAATEPGQLLPQGRRGEGPLVEQALSLVDAVRLSPVFWIGVFRASAGELVAAPFRQEGGSLVRASPGAGAAATLARLVAGHEALADGSFSVSRFVVDDSEDILAVSAVDVDERAMQVDQTHESVVVGDTAVVKWAVHAEPSPAPELIAHLAASGFTEMPQPWGFLTWSDGREGAMVASVMAYLPGASDGWTWAVLDAGDFAARGNSLQPSVESFNVIGATVADMHAALFTPTDVIETPERVAGAAQLEAWRERAYRLFEQAVGSVDGAEGDRLADLRGQIGGVFDTLSDVYDTSTIPIHGDLHIGQVLRWERGYSIGDFDGNPVLPASERLVAQPAARDVAGFVQSIDHVGRVVLRRVDDAEPRLVDEWIEAAQARFLSSYQARLAWYGLDHLFDDRLLRPFRVEQECREFLYAVRHLPRWRYVPDQAMQALFPKA